MPAVVGVVRGVRVVRMSAASGRRLGAPSETGVPPRRPLPLCLTILAPARPEPTSGAGLDRERVSLLMFREPRVGRRPRSRQGAWPCPAAQWRRFGRYRVGRPDLMTAFDLSALGYTETEYLVAGTASSYELAGERGTDGRWSVTPGAEAEFRTRIVVRRPLDAARFSGTVVVEWNNVSAGIDGSPDWILLHRHLAAQGHIWVGVTAQRAGVEGGGIVEGLHLKLLDPDRYEVLEHPGDAWSFDMFTQAGRLLRLPAGESPLGDLVPDRVLALGESQSAACLVTYINAVDPLAQVFDGFFVHGRPGRGVSVEGVFQPSRDLDAVTEAISSGGESIRADVRVPVLVLQSETDVVLLGGGRADQPDTDRIRVWEIAGAAHADSYIAGAGRHDDGKISAEEFAALPATDDQPADREDGQSDQLGTPAALRRAGRPGPPGALGLGRDGPAPCTAARTRPRAAGVPPRRRRHRARRHPYALGRRPRSRALRSRAERRDVRPAVRPDRALRRAEPLPSATPAVGRSTSSGSGRRSTSTVTAGFLLDDDRSEILAVAAASFPVVLAE